jgi:hypothetical protein
MDIAFDDFAFGRPDDIFQPMLLAHAFPTRGPPE